jgi:hypothetical protein
LSQVKGESASSSQGSPFSTEKVIVQIPAALAQRIKRRLTSSDFTSVDEYVTYVVDQVLTELEGSQGQSNTKNDNPFSKEDQENVEQRLRDLGYL